MNHPLAPSRSRANGSSPFRVLTVGWSHSLVGDLWDPISANSSLSFSHVLHPAYAASEWGQLSKRPDLHFLREHLAEPMPDGDARLLQSLEREGVPTIHNMILGDRVVSKLPYDDALRYATFLARRFTSLFKQVEPNVVIGGFDALHSGIALAVARHRGLPWFALNFSVIPPGLACFCDQLSPASRIQLGTPDPKQTREMAETALRRFEERSLQAHAYVAPAPAPWFGKLARLPSRIRAALRTASKARTGEFARFTDPRARHSVPEALRVLARASRARRAIRKVPMLATRPTLPFVLFGLHLQPESSIDVWAPFFSNQMWVIELLSRALPPTHRLLVKIHKSDVANYSSSALRRMKAFPGVELVQPFAETRLLIEQADLVVAIQGTIGLEAALLGKPVIMLGASPVTVFPSVAQISRIPDLPELIRSKLAERPPARQEIVAAFANYLSPFMPASLNVWGTRRTEQEIDGYVKLFDALEAYLTSERAMQSSAR